MFCILGSDGYIFDLLKNFYYYCINMLLDDEFEIVVVNVDGMRFFKSVCKIMEMMRCFEVYGYMLFWINIVCWNWNWYVYGGYKREK